MLMDYVPAYDAEIVEKMKQSGAVLLGKNRMDEFAMGSSGQRDFRGAVVNPLDAARVAGGSSGGSAAAVRAGLSLWSLGSDTGGSVTMPAAFCGVTGFTPSWGTLSRFGLIAFASGYDQPGILAETPGDVTAILPCLMTGTDKDTTLHPDRCMNYDPTPLEAPGVLGLPEEIWSLPMQDDVRRDYEEAVRVLEKDGWKLKKVSVPGIEKAVSLYQLITACQAYSNLSRYDGVRYGLKSDLPFEEAAEAVRSEGFGSEVKRRILMGAYLLGQETSGMPYYPRALAAVEQLKAAFASALKACDWLLMPTSLIPPFTPDTFRQHPAQAHQADLCTAGCNLARLPSLSIPFPAKCFPSMGLLLVGKRFQDGRLLRAGERVYREVNA